MDDSEASPYFYEYHRNESADPARELFHALGAWRASPVFHDLLRNPAFLLPAYQLLGSGVRFFHDQLFSKPSERGGVVAWHQDFAYWTWTTPMAHLTCWMGLDDVSVENGCVTYVPGSHRWGLLDRPSLAGDASSEMGAIRSSLTPEQAALFERRVPVEMRAGRASFHHPLLVHGSEDVLRGGVPLDEPPLHLLVEGTIDQR
ncbi:MAG: phytanoyl-CoA dioxygenase family protein, partial [Planctomycetota bacterium]